MNQPPPVPDQLPGAAEHLQQITLPALDFGPAALEAEHFNALLEAQRQGAFHTGWIYDASEHAHFLLIWTGERYTAEVRYYFPSDQPGAVLDWALFSVTGKADRAAALASYAGGVQEESGVSAAQAWQSVQRVLTPDLLLSARMASAQYEGEPLPVFAGPEAHADALEYVLLCGYLRAKDELSRRMGDLTDRLAATCPLSAHLN